MSEPHKPVGAIFDAAIELPPERRAAYLREACAGDDALRQRVEALLRAHESAESFMDTPAVDPAREPPPSKPAEQAGDRIGRYKLLQQIGEGGCGVVYMAEQQEPVRRKVALKVIKLGMDTKQVIARFEAERQALALMDHSNIAKVFDAGTTETGRPYFVMELVRGIRITDYCDQGSLSTRQRLDLFTQVCRAIQHAHQKGIIHRDIKPSNILVTVNDGVAVPKVIDFGIAKATQGRLTDQTVFTAFEQFLGTPAYMSPEQASMTSLDIDTRSDIYSLGVLLYELLTGQTPFDTKELLAAGLDELRRTIREKEPPRPSTRLSTMLAGDLATVAKSRQSEPFKLIHQTRGDLDWIVMKCLEKDRARRYDTANGLAMDIQRHLADEPVVARPPSRLYEFRKTVRRHKFGFAATGLIGVVLVAATGISARQATLARERLAESEAISKFLTEVFQSPDPARDGLTITVAERLGVAAKNLETELASQPARRAKLQATLGSTYNALGLYREAIPLQEKVRDYYLAVFGSENINTLKAMHNLAWSYNRIGRLDEAIKIQERVLTLGRKLLGPEDSDTLSAMHQLAISYDDIGRLDEALKLRAEVLPLRLKVSGPDDDETVWAMFDLSHSYHSAGRLEEALKLREQVLALRRKLNGLHHASTILAMEYVADSYADFRSRLGDALKLQEEVVELSKKVNGPEHPYTLKAIDVFAGMYDRADRFDEALKLREELLALRRKVLGNDSPAVGETLLNLAANLDAQGKQAEAEHYYREAAGHTDAQTLAGLAWLLATGPDPKLRDGTNAVVFAEKAVAATNRKNVSYLDTLAAAHAETGQFAKAISIQQEAIALSQREQERQDLGSRLKLYENNSPYRDHGSLAELTRDRLLEGKFAEAEGLARECLALREREIPDDWRTLNARSMLGGSLLGQKKYAEAEPLLLSGYEGMKQREANIPIEGKPRLKEALQRLVQLYEATDRPNQAAEWKRRLAEFEKTEK